jgi:uncharacterized protein (DUF885 family)
MKLRRNRALSFAAIAGFGLLINGAAAAPADDLAKLLSDHDEAQLQLFPSNAIQRNDRRHLGRFEDSLSGAHLAEARRLNAEHRVRLTAIDRSALSVQHRLTYDIFAWLLSIRAGDLAPGRGEMLQMLALDHFNGGHLTFAREMAWRGRYPYMTAGDFDRAILRMKGFSHWLDTAIARMREGAAKGIALPRLIVERMVPQIEQFTASAPEASLFMGPVKIMPHSIRPPDRARITADFERAIRNDVLPAYWRLLVFLRTEYLPKARPSAGLFALPGGRSLYLHDVRARTTVAMTPGAISRARSC